MIVGVKLRIWLALSPGPTRKREKGLVTFPYVLCQHSVFGIDKSSIHNQLLNSWHVNFVASFQDYSKMGTGLAYFFVELNI